MEGAEKPRKVLFLTACTGRGGAGNSLFHICEHLDRTRFEPLVVMPSDGLIGEKLRALDIPTILCPRLRERSYEQRFSRTNGLTAALSFVWNLWDSVIFFFQLSAIARRHHVDVIYGNHMMVKLMAVGAGSLTRRPVILHCRTVYASRIERALYVTFARMRHVRRVIAVSEASALQYRPLSHKLEVVPNGISFPAQPPEATDGWLKEELHIPGDNAVVGFVGRLVEWKGIEVFLDAAERLSKSGGRVSFVVLGDVPAGATKKTLDDYRREAAGRGLADFVYFVGFQQDTQQYIKDFDALSIPSILPDPCPRVVLEGLAVGTPVIGSNGGGIAETLIHGETGLLAEPGSVDDLVTQVRRILDDPALAERISAAGIRIARQTHDARAVSQRIQGIITEVLSDRQAGPALGTRPEGTGTVGAHHS